MSKIVESDSIPNITEGIYIKLNNIYNIEDDTLLFSANGKPMIVAGSKTIACLANYKDGFKLFNIKTNKEFTLEKGSGISIIKPVIENDKAFVVGEYKNKDEKSIIMSLLVNDKLVSKKLSKDEFIDVEYCKPKFADKSLFILSEVDRTLYDNMFFESDLKNKKRIKKDTFLSI